MKITRGTHLSVIFTIFILLLVWSVAASGHGVAIGGSGVAPAVSIVAVYDDDIAITN
jgi:hypothetical protein